MKPCLVVIRNENDVRRVKKIPGCYHFVLTALQIMVTDMYGQKLPFLQNRERIKEISKKELTGLSYELIFPEYSMTKLPAEEFLKVAKEKSCKEIIVFAEKFNENSHYYNNLASTLAVISDIPIRVIKV